jgi:hypothetical protein
MLYKSIFVEIQSQNYNCSERILIISYFSTVFRINYWNLSKFFFDFESELMLRIMSGLMHEFLKK